MYITGPWNLGEFKSRLPDSLQSAWATAALPGPDGPASGLSTAGGSSLVVFRSSRHPNEAWRFVEYLVSPAVQARFFHRTGSLPARRQAWSDSALAGDPRVDAFRQQLERVQAMPRVPESEQIAIKLQERAEAVIRGAQTADEALTALDREVDQVLEKRRWLVSRTGAAQ
jgi:multiple sugar transport system substrate-binding protein